jgi:hypothetical protein
MALLRHEINLITSTYSVAGTSTEFAYFDPAKFSGTLTVYFEVLATNTNGSASTVGLFNKTTNNASFHTVSVAASTSTYTLFRSTATTVSTAADFGINNVSGVSVKAARLIIFQDTGSDPVAASESQFEIGNKETGRINTAATGLSTPKYFKWEPSKWDGTVSVSVDAVASIANNMFTFTVQLQYSTDGGTNWTGIGSGTPFNAATNTAATRARSTLTTDALNSASWQSGGLYDGALFRISTSSSSNMTTHDLYGAKMVVTQTSVVQEGQTIHNTEFTMHGASAIEWVSQSFTASSSYSMKAVELKMYSVGTPTDKLYVEVYSGSAEGTLLGTSKQASFPTTSTSGEWKPFLFTSPITITSGTKYWIRLRRTTTDTTNYVQWLAYNLSNITGGEPARKESGSVVTYSTFELTFKTVTAIMSKTQEQYLLTNTASTGVNAQTSYTKWDSSEWSGVTNSYYHAVSNGNSTVTSAKLRDASNTDVTNSTAGGVVHYAISSAMTMPTSAQNIDTYLTSSPLYSSRIIADVNIHTRFTTILVDWISVTVNHS